MTDRRVGNVFIFVLGDRSRRDDGRPCRPRAAIARAIAMPPSFLEGAHVDRCCCSFGIFRRRLPPRSSDRLLLAAGLGWRCYEQRRRASGRCETLPLSGKKAGGEVIYWSVATMTADDDHHRSVVGDNDEGNVQNVMMMIISSPHRANRNRPATYSCDGFCGGWMKQ